MPAYTVKPLFFLCIFHPSAQGSARFPSGCHRKGTVFNIRIKSQPEGID